MSLVWNASPFRVGPALAPPEDGDIPGFGFDRSSFAFVLEHATPYVRRVLDAVALEGKRRHVVVDVRVETIVPGRAPGILGWHFDTVGDAHHPSAPEVHHLFVTGTASLTEFAVGPLALEPPPGLRNHALMRAIDRALATRTFATVRVPSCTLVTYGRFDLHRATPGLHEARRLLVRVTETDVLRPYDRIVPLDAAGRRDGGGAGTVPYLPPRP